MFNPAALQSEQLILNYPIEQVFQAVLAAARGGRFRLRDYNEKLYRVIIQSGASAFSWGENLTIQLSPFNDGTAISITSQQKTWVGSGSAMNQLTIGRRNKKNIDQLLNDISDYL
ncbi:MAG: hypothetical protein ACOYI6_04370 [Christensenellales bacterium]|jgi:hypothetical protein